MSVDWTQPYILIFEWGLFIFGWLLVTVLSAIVLVIAYAVLKATVMTILGKRTRVSRNKDVQGAEVKRDIYGRFTL